MKQARLRLFFLLAICSVLFFGWFGLPKTTYAFHFPWDQGHDVFTPENSDDDTDPKDNICNASGSPFEVASGNYTLQVYDLRVPSLGLDLVIRRTYNSRDMRSGPLGHGWTHVYDQRLVYATDGVSFVGVCLQGNGKRTRFLQSDDGSFLPPIESYAELLRNSDGSFVLIDINGLHREFDTHGRLTLLRTRNGNETNLSYDATGFLEAVTDSGGRSLRFLKGANGKISSISAPGDRKISFEYDGEANLAKVTDAEGAVFQYWYDTKHNLTSITDQFGNTLRQIGYDNEERVSSFTEQHEVWSVAYFPDQNKTVKTDSSGNNWSIYYNDNGNVVRIIDPLGNEEKYAYDDKSNFTSITNKNGKAFSLLPDENGKLIKISDPLGNSIQFTYDIEVNKVKTLTNQLGNTWEMFYDNQGNLESIHSPLQASIHYEYNKSGLLASSKNPSGSTQSYAYDSYGNLSAVVDPLGNSTTFEYDETGMLRALIDAIGRTTHYEYDSNNRLIASTTPAGSIIGFTYDNNGDITSVTDTRQNTTNFERDIFGNVTRVTNELGQQGIYNYDNKGRIVQFIDAKGQLFTYTYDKLSRLISRTTPDNNFSYDYDASGNITRLQDNDSELLFLYDSLGRIVEARTSSTSAQSATVIRYTYDEAGNLQSVLDPEGGITTYSFDELNRIESMANSFGEMTQYSYDAQSRRSSITLANGVSIDFSYDQASQLTSAVHSIQGDELLRFDYTYDVLGNRVSLMETNRSRMFDYDVMNRLTSVTDTISSNQEQYSYDLIGNRLTSHTSPFYNHDTANRLIEDASFTYSYDENGNMIEKVAKQNGATTNYQYDADNQLTEVTLPDGMQVSYRYDALGRRIETTINGVISRFVYSREDIISEYDIDGELVASYTHGPGIDEPISVRMAGISYFYHADGIGSITALTDSNGALVQEYTYDSYGRILDELGSVKNSYRFAGREYDLETGLYHFRSRAYDPNLGRFLQTDPAGFGGGDLNLYAYVLNDPINWIDPMGLCSIEVRFNPLGPGFYYHAYIIQTDLDGTQTYYRGGPSAGGPSSGGSGAISSGGSGSSSQSSGSGSSGSGSGSSNISNSSSPGSSPGGPNQNNGPWGPIVTQSGRYLPGTIDWNPGPVPTMPVFNNNEPCAQVSQCQTIGGAMNDIENANIPYNPFSTNSNATVREVLERAGLNPGQPPVWAPGWNTQLP